MNDELDNMKQIWQNNPTAAASLDEVAMLRMIAQRSNDAYSKLRRNLLFEAIFAVCCLAFVAFRIIKVQDTQAQMALVQLFVLILPLFLFYYFGYRNLQKNDLAVGNFRESLQSNIQFWQRALRFYFWGGALLFPIVVIALGWYQMRLGSSGALVVFAGGPWVVLAKILGITIFASGLTWLLVRWSYGIYVDRLKNCLRELTVDVDF
jgi:preprotein translocase subunit YajC